MKNNLSNLTKKRIAVIIPAYNEELTIVQTITDFRESSLIDEIFVIDNNCTDGTVAAVKNMPDFGINLHLMYERKQGKGAAIRRAFREVNADYYVMVDGDSTYSAKDLPNLLYYALNEKYDMVVGNRHANAVYHEQNKRRYHNFGNRLVQKILNSLYSQKIEDILSGYRVFTKEFVKNYPIRAQGFELETEMSLHALDRNYSIIDVPIEYRDRPEGSASKLRTFSDGKKILMAILRIYRFYQPLKFFGFLAGMSYLIGIFLGMPALLDYVEFRYVYHLPLAVLGSTFAVLGTLMLITAIILDALADSDYKAFEANRLRNFS